MAPVTWLGGNTTVVPGYDLRGVFIGSEGTFGIATKIVLRLLPVPEAVKTLLGVFEHVDSACTAVSTIIAQGIVPAALEMIDSVTIKAVQNVTNAGFPEHAGAVLLVEIEGLTEDVAELGGEVEAALWDTGAIEVRAAVELHEREKLWLARKGALGALGSLAPNYYLVDGVVPRAGLTEALRRVGEVGQEYGFVIANVAHAGDGNLHPCVLFDERVPGQIEKVMEIGGEILKICVEGRGYLDRRARCRPGEKGLHAAGIHSAGHGRDDEGPPCLRAQWPVQPRQGISRWPGIRSTIPASGGVQRRPWRICLMHEF